MPLFRCKPSVFWLMRYLHLPISCNFTIDMWPEQRSVFDWWKLNLELVLLRAMWFWMVHAFLVPSSSKLQWVLENQESPKMSKLQPLQFQMHVTNRNQWIRRNDSIPRSNSQIVQLSSPLLRLDRNVLSLLLRFYAQKMPSSCKIEKTKRRANAANKSLKSQEETRERMPLLLSRSDFLSVFLPRAACTPFESEASFGNSASSFVVSIWKSISTLQLFSEEVEIKSNGNEIFLINENSFSLCLDCVFKKIAIDVVLNAFKIRPSRRLSTWIRLFFHCWVSGLLSC